MYNTKKLYQEKLKKKTKKLNIDYYCLDLKNLGNKVHGSFSSISHCHTKMYGIFTAPFKHGSNRLPITLKIS